MPPLLRTTRLVLPPLALADAAAIQARFPRWEIVRHLTDRVPWPYPADGASNFIREVALPAMRNGVAWHWSIRPSDRPATLIGVVSLMDGDDDNRGCWLDPDWQGRGLATEAIEAVTAFWFTVLDRPVLRVPKAAANERSRRLSERTGMRHVGRTTRHYVSGPQPADLWEITREDWHHHAP